MHVSFYVTMSDKTEGLACPYKHEKSVIYACKKESPIVKEASAVVYMYMWSKTVMMAYNN